MGRVEEVLEEEGSLEAVLEVVGVEAGNLMPINKGG